jgi:uncharacterized membrane protein
MHWVAFGLAFFVVVGVFWWAIKDHVDIGTGHS